VTAFDFSLNSTQAVKDLQAQVLDKATKRAQIVSQATLDPDFVRLFTYSSDQVDNEIALTLPLESAISFFS